MTSAYKKADKGMRSLFSHLDQTSLVNKGLFMAKQKLCLWELKARNPKWVR